MRKHLLLVSTLEAEEILSGQSEYLIRFFKKRFEFINRLEKGDLIYLRKKGGEVLAQFNIGKLVLIEGLEIDDYKILKNFSASLGKELFEEKINENNILIIIQIQKLEQFITSPIQIPKHIKKEWVVLE